MSHCQDGLCIDKIELNTVIIKINPPSTSSKILKKAIRTECTLFPGPTKGQGKIHMLKTKATLVSKILARKSIPENSFCKKPTTFHDCRTLKYNKFH